MDVSVHVRFQSTNICFLSKSAQMQNYADIFHIQEFQ